MLGAHRHFPHVGRGVDHGVAVQVHARAAAAVEQVDLRGIADAEERALQRDRVTHAQRARLGLGDGHVEDVVGHVRTRRQCRPG